MENKRKILVIEDDGKHYMDARNFFSEHSELEVRYANSYERAKKIMYDSEGKIKEGIDGVISDIYFPIDYQESTQEDPMGVRVAIELSNQNVPFVLNTAGYHHGKKYEWINGLAYSQGWRIIDNGICNDIEVDTKNWEKAYETLEDLIKKSKE